jgi:hypothetical protein
MGKCTTNDHRIYKSSIKYAKRPEVYPMAIKFAKSYHSKALKDAPKFGFLVCKYTIWQPCSIPMSATLIYECNQFFFSSRATTLHPGGVRSHDP